MQRSGFRHMCRLTPGPSTNVSDIPGILLIAADRRNITDALDGKDVWPISHFALQMLIN
jgi:hypothetical protein